MNGYQRINAALNGEMPDKRPVMLHNFMLAIDYAGYTMKEYRENPDIAAKCLIQFTEKFDLDGVFFDVDTALMADAVGCHVDFPNDEPARVYGHFLRTLDDVDSLEEIDISTHPRIQHAIETMKILRKHFGYEKFLRANCDQAPFSLACCMRGPEVFMTDLMLQRELSMKLIEYTTRRSQQLIKLMCKTGVDMVSNGDSPAGPDMISPNMYRKFAYQAEKVMLETAHTYKIPYLLHICGKTTSILPAMAEMGLDAVELDYKTPIDLIYQHFSTSTTLFGTVDPCGIIAFGTPDNVRQEILKIANMYKDNYRLVLGARCAIPPKTPEENIRMFVNTVHGL